MEINDIINVIFSGLSALTVIVGGIFAYYKFKKEFNQIKQEFQNSKSIEESQHRQEWLDSFRNDIASYFDVVSSIINFNYIDNERENISELYSKHHTILLKLNPENEIDRELELGLDKLTYNLKIFEIYNNNKEKIQFDALIKIITDVNLYYNLKDSSLVQNLINAYNAYDKYTEIFDNPDNTKSYCLTMDPMILDADYDEANFNVINNFTDGIEREIKYYKNQMHLKFRVYLKTEWERIKALISNDLFNFEEEYNKVFESLSNNMDK